MYKISPSEIYDCIGKRVKAAQLDNIYDTYIILTDVKLIQDKLGICDHEGIIDEVSKTPIRLSKENSTLVYNDSFEAEDFCGYE